VTKTISVVRDVDQLVIDECLIGLREKPLKDSASLVGALHDVVKLRHSNAGIEQRAQIRAHIFHFNVQDSIQILDLCAVLIFSTNMLCVQITPLQVFFKFCAVRIFVY
jgi:hypothetical protein